MKKFREQHEKFIVEGMKSIQEAIKELPKEIDRIYYVKGKHTSSDFKGIESLEITEKEMAGLSHLKTPSSTLAVVNYFNPKKKQISLLKIALDGIQDPGNLGTIIRLADWFGITEIYCSKNTVDCYNSKVVQATMGSLFRTNIQYVDLARQLNDFDGEILGAFMDGQSMRDYEISKPTILVMGNEGKGISQEIEPLITSKISIPGSGNAESLNVGIATGILVSHLV